MTPKPDNPRGFWERRDVAAINDRLLQSLNSSWCDVARFDPKAIPKETMERGSVEAASVIAELDQDRPWVLKDPRLSLLLPVWRRLLEAPLCVLVHRCPIEVARSIKERNGYPLSFGVSLWERYMLDALAGSRGVPRLIISYRELIDEPERTVERLLLRLRRLGCKGLRRPDSAKITGFLSKELCHQKSSSALDSEILNESQKALVRSLEDGSALARDEQQIPSVAARDVLELFHVELDRRRRVGQLETEIRSLSQKLESSRNDGSELAKLLTARREEDRELTEAKVRSAQVEAERTAVLEQLKQRETDIERLQTERDRAREERATAEQRARQTLDQLKARDDEVAAVRKQCEISESQGKKLLEDLEVAKRATATSEGRIQELLLQLRVKEQELVAEKTALSARVSQIEESGRREEELRNRLERSTAREQSLTIRNEALTEKEAELRRTLNEVEERRVEELELHKAHVEESEQSRAALREQVRELNEELESVREEHAALEERRVEELELHKAHVEESEQSRAALREQVRELDEELASVRREHAALEERRVEELELHKAHIEESEQSRAALREQVRELNEQIGQARLENAALENRSSEEAHRYECQLEEAEQRFVALTSDLEAARRSRQEVQGALTELRSRLAHDEELRLQGEQDRERLAGELAEFAADRARLTKAIAELRARALVGPSREESQRTLQSVGSRVDAQASTRRAPTHGESSEAGMLVKQLEWRLRRVQVRSEETIDRRNELIATLASELRHVLTSRRWRVVMGVVRARQLLGGRPEGDPVEAHLTRHLRAYGFGELFRHEEADQSLLRQGDNGPLEAFRALVVDPPKKSGELVVLPKDQAREIKKTLVGCSQKALVSVVMPSWNRAPQLPRAIESVRQQTYQNWELIVVDDGSDDDTETVVTELASLDHRIQYRRIEHQGVSAARNEGLNAARGEIVAYLDSDNVWQPDYLLFTVNAVIEADRGCVYSALKIIDHDRNDETSFRKRAFDLEALLKNNYIDINVFAHRADLTEKLGGFDVSLARWVDWDLILRYVRVFEPAQIPVVLCHYSRREKLHQITMEEPEAYKFKVLNKHLIDWEAFAADASRRVRGHASIVIPVFGKAELTTRCLESINKNTPAGTFDVVVVDNGGPLEERSTLTELESRYPNCTVVRNYENYMFALGNNIGAAASRGEFLVLLNNDTEVLPGWLEALLDPLKSDEAIGVVGPKLLYPDDTLQCGGLVFNDQSPIPYHIYRGLPRHHPAVCKPRYFQVVTGACMAIRAIDYAHLRGFDPIFVNGGEDVDFCLRMQRDLGKLVFYNPEAEIYHLEGKSPGRGRFISYNRKLLVQRWGSAVVPDDSSYYEQDGFSVERYEKPGAEEHGETAAYVPVLTEIEARLTESNHENGAFGISRRKGRLLNVGFCSMWYARGVTFVTKQLADSLEGPDLRTHIFARWESERFSNTGTNFHPRVVNAGDDPTQNEIVEWARSCELDLMIFVEVHPKDWKRVDALKREGIPVMCYEHLDILRRELLDRYAIFDAFLHNSFYCRHVLRERFPEIPHLTIPWAVPAELCNGHGDSGGGVGEGGPVRCVHVSGWGGLGNRKNSDLVLRAFDQAGDVDAELHFYTQAGIEHFGAEYRDIIRANNRIVLHQGTIGDISDAYQGMDLLLWPSKREGLGLPIVESLASGLPVLVSEGYMMEQWLIPESHGFLCPATAKQTQMYLPEMQVDQGVLTRLIRHVTADRETLRGARRQVQKDRQLWVWSWQAEVLREQIRKMVEEPGYVFPDDLSYIPAHHLEFERTRERSRQNRQPHSSSQVDEVASSSPQV